MATKGGQAHPPQAYSEKDMQLLSPQTYSGNVSLATRIWDLKHQVDNEGRNQVETSLRFQRLLDDAKSMSSSPTSTIGFSEDWSSENMKLRMEIERVHQERDAAIMQLKENEQSAARLRRMCEEEVLKLQEELNSERKLRDADAAEVVKILMTEIQALTAQLQSARQTQNEKTVNLSVPVAVGDKSNIPAMPAEPRAAGGKGKQASGPNAPPSLPAKGKGPSAPAGGQPKGAAPSWKERRLEFQSMEAAPVAVLKEMSVELSKIPHPDRPRLFPKPGDRVAIHYKARKLASGEEVDTSFDGEPFEFTVGAGEAINGWDNGIPQVPLGAEAILKVPATLAYGKEDLAFEVKLLSINGCGATSASSSSKANGTYGTAHEAEDTSSAKASSDERQPQLKDIIVSDELMTELRSIPLFGIVVPDNMPPIKLQQLGSPFTKLDGEEWLPLSGQDWVIIDVKARQNSEPLKLKPDLELLPGYCVTFLSPRTATVRGYLPFGEEWKDINQAVSSLTVGSYLRADSVLCRSDYIQKSTSGRICIAGENRYTLLAGAKLVASETSHDKESLRDILEFTFEYPPLDRVAQNLGIPHRVKGTYTFDIFRFNFPTDKHQYRRLGLRGQGVPGLDVRAKYGINILGVIHIDGISPRVIWSPPPTEQIAVGEICVALPTEDVDHKFKDLSDVFGGHARITVAPVPWADGELS